jgi:glutathione S-transferase
MATYQLISFKTCPWVQRAAIVLREKGVPFEFIHIEPGNRPDWFHAISPHGKVPVLRIGGTLALFESNAIAEYLDETIEPRLHPEKPVRRAINRAWTDHLPVFASVLSAVSGAADAAAHAQALEGLRTAFGKLEHALSTPPEKGPWFNGSHYSLVDAGYAPFLQRWQIVEALTGISELAAYPRLADWTRALIERPTTHSFPPEEFEALYRDALSRRGGWLARNVAQAAE